MVTQASPAQDVTTAGSNYSSALRVALASLVRGVALFLGGFTLLNLLGEMLHPGFDANIWWIDLRPMAALMAKPLLAIGALCLLGFGVGIGYRWFRLAAFLVCAGLLGVTISNTAQYYRVRASGEIYSGAAIPFSLILAVTLAFIALGLLLHKQGRTGRVGKGVLAATLLVCVGGFPTAQVYCFGTTDYRRPADVIVVFGAKAYSNDVPSAVLADRVETACDLYHAGLAPWLIVSGGPAQGGAHETEAMRRLAMRLGVPNSAIIIDKQGLSTADTVRNTSRIFRQLRTHRILAVSHSFHLPRIKMSYQRAGWEVFTVPTQETSLSRSEKRFMLVRETAALWSYYMKG